VLDIDLRSYFDNDRLLGKVAQRVDDADVMHLLMVMLKASGKQGVPQRGVISPLLSNIYLTACCVRRGGAGNMARASPRSPPNKPTRHTASHFPCTASALYSPISPR
jgi:hypothetical protein